MKPGRICAPIGPKIRAVVIGTRICLDLWPCSGVGVAGWASQSLSQRLLLMRHASDGNSTHPCDIVPVLIAAPVHAAMFDLADCKMCRPGTSMLLHPTFNSLRHVPPCMHLLAHLLLQVQPAGASVAPRRHLHPSEKGCRM
eukprot:363794-Chlamydomonas_euryale.AAC.7